MIHRVCGYLLATYCLAWFMPWGSVFGEHSTEAARGLSKGLLALLLVLGSAGQATVLGTPRLAYRTLAGALLVTWLASLSGMLFVVSFLHTVTGVHRDQIQLGLLIVSVMPVANATIAWANLCHADRALSLLLLIVSTVAAPVLTFAVMQLLSLGDSGLVAKAQFQEVVWNQDAIMFLVCWVLIPAAIGILVFRISGPNIRARSQRYASHLSLPILLILNYINASNCLPFVPLDVASILEFLSAVVGFQVVALLAFVILNRLRAAWYPMPIDQQRSIAFAVLLKNTGAALVLISSLVAEPALLLLPVLLSTLTQHLLASLLGQTQCLLVNGQILSDPLPSPLAVRSPRV